LHRAFIERRPPDVTVLADGTRLLTTPAPSYGAVLAAAIQDLDASGACGAAAEVDAASRARARFDARAEGGTSVVTAADDEGNLVVLVHSNSFPQYGSGLVLEDYDLVLNNRPGRGFAAEVDAEHWNAPAPGRIPATTLQAWMVAPSSGPWREHWGATPGGQNQVAWNLQALQTLLKRGPRAAAESPRWGFTRTGVVVERDLDEAHALATRPQAHLCDEGSLRSVLQIQSVPRRSGPSQAVADPRTGALACAAAS
jgi:gamma-glutamyltranspeptidase/glutathione hydrolase